MIRRLIELEGGFEVYLVVENGEIRLESENATVLLTARDVKDFEGLRRRVSWLFPDVKKRDLKSKLTGRLQKALLEEFRRLDRGPSSRREDGEEFEPEVLEEVERILNSPDPMREIDKHLGNIVAGEKNNRQAIFVLCYSGKVRNPRMKQIIVLKGEPGAGKSTLMRIADLFRAKDVGRFTEHALDYSDLEGYEILKIKEFGHMDEEKQGTATVKFLSSDDQGYTVEYTVRDPETGRMMTEQKRIRPITVITSTTRVELDPQFERRTWVFNPDESPGQTERVLKFKIRMDREGSEKALGLRDETTFERSFKVLKALVSRLEPCEVIVPFPRTLAELLDRSVLRARGDFDKILTFVKLFHIFYQRQLPAVEANGRKVLLAFPWVTVRALGIVLEPLTSMMTELEKRTRQLISVLEEMGITDEGAEIGKGERDEIAKRLGKSSRTVLRYLNEWESAGYVSSEGGRGKEKVFTLIRPLGFIKRKAAGMRAIDRASPSLVAKMCEEAREFLNKYRDKPALRDAKKFFVDMAEALLPPPENEICTTPPGLSHPPSGSSPGSPGPDVQGEMDASETARSCTVLEKSDEKTAGAGDPGGRLEEVEEVLEEFFRGLGMSQVQLRALAWLYLNQPARREVFEAEVASLDNPDVKELVNIGFIVEEEGFVLLRRETTSFFAGLVGEDG